MDIVMRNFNNDGDMASYYTCRELQHGQTSMLSFCILGQPAPARAPSWRTCDGRLLSAASGGHLEDTDTARRKPPSGRQPRDALGNPRPRLPPRPLLGRMAFWT